MSKRRQEGYWRSFLYFKPNKRALKVQVFTDQWGVSEPYLKDLDWFYDEPTMADHIQRFKRKFPKLKGVKFVRHEKVHVYPNPPSHSGLGQP